MNRYNIKHIIIFSFFLVIMVSCSGKNEEKIPETKKHSSEKISLNDHQKQYAGIETGKISKERFLETLTCFGTIEPTPRSLARIAVPYGGFIKSINFFVGDKVRKGEILAEIQNPEFIDLQEDYLKNMAELEYLEKEYERQGSLNLDDAASMKKFQKAKADYLTMNARVLGAKSKLEILGINPQKIQGNEIQSSFFVRAPISGNISGIYGNLGKFVEKKDVIFEIIDPDKTHLHIKIFEKDVSKVKAGQTVIFSTQAMPGKKYEALIISQGRSINDNDKTITLHAKITTKDEDLIPGLYTNAEIIINSIDAYAIPKEGYISGEDMGYIFLYDNAEYKRVPIKSTFSNEKFVAIADPDESIINSELVLKGAYFIQAALESREEE